MRRTLTALTAIAAVAGLSACVPSATNPFRPTSFNLTVDNSRCQGTYRNVFVYRNNVILGQVQGEPRVFLSVPEGSADFKATPVLGTSPAVSKSIRIQGDTTWRVCE